MRDLIDLQIFKVKLNRTQIRDLQRARADSAASKALLLHFLPPLYSNVFATQNLENIFRRERD